MTDAPARAPRRIVVIGGGITGLAAANRILELSRERSRPVELLVLEASERLGGVVRTETRDGFVLEAGPDSFITDKPWGLELSRRLGLQDRLIGTNPTSRRSFVLRGGRLIPVPEGFHLLAPSQMAPFLASSLLSWPGKLRVLLEAALPARPPEGDESLADFVNRRLGHEVLERVAQPMIAGIYGADPRSLSLQATMPRFLELERTHGSVIRGLLARRGRQKRGDGAPSDGAKADACGAAQRAASGAAAGAPASQAGRGVSGARYGLFVSFRDGMQTLVDALVEQLPAETVRRSTRVSRISLTSDARWQVATDGLAGELALQADAVCVALPAYRTAALIGALDPPLADQLGSIPYASAATVNMAFRRQDVAHPLDGFGFVVPAIEKRLLLGCTFSSVKFPGRAPDGYVLLRAFLGENGLESRDDDTVAAGVQAELGEILGIRGTPCFTSVSRHERAMAHYHVGHLDRVAVIEAAVARHPGLALAGNAYRGIGIPDCIHSGEQAADRLFG